MKKYVQYAALLSMLAVMTLVSCREMVNLNRPEDYLVAETSWSSVFESFWTGMNNNYLFWDIDPGDWDAMYQKYEPEFARLSLNNPYDSLYAFTYFQDMTKDIVDGHYQLRVTDLYGNVIDITPRRARYYQEYGEDLYAYMANGYQFDRLAESLRHSDYFAERDREDNSVIQTAVKNYLTASYDYARVSDWSTSTEFNINYSNFKVVSGTLPANGGGRILYFHFTNFYYYAIENVYKQLVAMGIYAQIADDGRSEAQLLADDSGISDIWRLALETQQVLRVTQTFFEELKKPDIKGVILDLRDNTGGYTIDLSYILGRMITKERTVAYTRSKLSDNRLDYTPWLPFNIFPAPDAVDIKVPIVALVSRSTASAGEQIAMSVATLGNGYVLGGETWGAYGSLIDNRVFNGGQFSAPLIDIVYTPSMELRSVDGVSYEGRGFPPDIPVPFDYDALQTGKDTRLEAAIKCVEDHQ